MLHLLLPGDVADPASPSGGNAYDLRIAHELAAGHGWLVRRTDLPGTWPRPDRAAAGALATALAATPDGALVLIDGLVACGVPEIIEPAAARLRLAVLVHLPLADETGLPPALATRLDARERRTLHAATAVVVTSAWAARRLARHELPAGRVHVAEPGVEPGPLAHGTDGASALLCVASLTPRKGQDRLIAALAELTDRRWSLTCAGPAQRDPAYTTALRAVIDRSALAGRVELTGPLTVAQVGARYEKTDLALLPSWTETYGMVVTEALVRGIPVLASTAGALPETLGRAPDGTRPGLLVPPGDHPALVSALRSWFDDGELRNRLRTAARMRRSILPGWDRTAASLHAVLGRLY